MASGGVKRALDSDTVPAPDETITKKPKLSSELTQVVYAVVFTDCDDAPSTRTPLKIYSTKDKADAYVERELIRRVCQYIPTQDEGFENYWHRKDEHTADDDDDDAAVANEEDDEEEGEVGKNKKDDGVERVLALSKIKRNLTELIEIAQEDTFSNEKKFTWSIDKVTLDQDEDE